MNFLKFVGPILRALGNPKAFLGSVADKSDANPGKSALTAILVPVVTYFGLDLTRLADALDPIIGALTAFQGLLR